MRTDGKAEKQHYVPQVLLRLHMSTTHRRRAGPSRSGGKAKQTDKIFPANIRGVLVEATDSMRSKSTARR